MPFVTTQRILKSFYPPEEFEIIIVYGPLGYGKSTFACKVLAEVLGEVYKISEEEAWETVKQFVIFHPEQFFAKLDEIKASGLKRVPTVLWDDAGLWLYALEWDDPFVEAVGKYLNVARTHLASLICTTPSPTWIFKKLRKFPQATNIKIMKSTGNKYQRFKRLARAYKQWTSPDLKRTGVRTLFQDYFDCRMPNDFYWKWYKPLRDGYEDMAANLMKEQWAKAKEKSKATMLEDYPQLEVPKLSFNQRVQG